METLNESVITPTKSEAGLESFGNLGVLVFMRWVTLCFGIVVFYSRKPESINPVFYVAIAMLTALTLLRSFYSIDLTKSLKNRLINFSFDLAVITLAIALSDQFKSPFIFTAIPVLILFGISHGLIVSISGAAISVAIITETIFLKNAEGQPLHIIAQNVIVFISAAAIGTAIGGYVRDTNQRSQLVVDEVKRMGKANELLLALHDIAQTLPASLDLGEVLATSRSRFNDLYDFEFLSILVADSTHNTFRVELTQGIRLNSPLSVEELPAPLHQALSANGAVIHNTVEDDFVGCSDQANSGMYIALRARGNIVGIIAIEHSEANRYTERDSTLLSELCEPLALAIDNGLWFARLRNLGAEEERNRIARDLHDRLAQALAYVAFELERLIGEKPEETELVELRDIVREVVGDLRETLYELRATIDSGKPFHVLAHEYIPRFGDRTGLDVQFSTNITKNILPTQIEREMWRITQEALNNVNKHADARHVWVSWMHLKNRVVLTVRDDGKGFDLTNRKKESFGLIGMRERADTIHAQLRVSSDLGKGTTIETEVEVPK